MSNYNECFVYGSHPDFLKIGYMSNDNVLDEEEKSKWRDKSQTVSF